MGSLERKALSSGLAAALQGPVPGSVRGGLDCLPAVPPLMALAILLKLSLLPLPLWFLVLQHCCTGLPWLVRCFVSALLRGLGPGLRGAPTLLGKGVLV